MIDQLLNKFDLVRTQHSSDYRMVLLSDMQADSILIAALIALVALVIGYFAGVLSTKLRARGEVKSARQDAVNRSRAVLTGHFSEQIAPFLPNFPYSPTELRFVGKPIDYIVFEGLDQHSVRRVVFLEVKSGRSTLNDAERSLRNAVEAGNIAFEVYQAPSYRAVAASKSLT